MNDYPILWRGDAFAEPGIPIFISEVILLKALAALATVFIVGVFMDLLSRRKDGRKTRSI